MSPQTMSIVWFKKDLRITDHAPLAEATRRGSVLCLYIYEPMILHSAEFDGSHLQFLNESLAELREEITRRGGVLLMRTGEAVAVLEELRQQSGFARLYSHEETGNGASYVRDIAVGKWARSVGVEWQEFPQNGVVRRLKSRDGWARNWEARMSAPLVPAPHRIDSPKGFTSEPLQTYADLSVEPSIKYTVQRGGSVAGHLTLEDFLYQRGRNYSRELSSPVTADRSCSRLSVYLSYGCLSMREVWHIVQKRRLELAELPEERKQWGGALRAFSERLHWHCHFMQKLELEPRLEFENLHRACDGLRENDFNEEYFQRWCEGTSGYPMVDACMRYVKQTGWLNFRMRAMLVSFASYDLWLHWRRPAVFLAKHFLDFEPGIHFSQFQMQSGTTGINTIRIYSPTKQAQDHDPKGEFIRRWLPELAGVSDLYIHEPWTMPSDMQHRVGCVMGKHYSTPVVDHKQAVAEAKARIYPLRRQPEAREQAREVLKRHGSRKRPASPRGMRTQNAPDLFENSEAASDA